MTIRIGMGTFEGEEMTRIAVCIGETSIRCLVVGHCGILGANVVRYQPELMASVGSIHRGCPVLRSSGPAMLASLVDRFPIRDPRI
jgi:hypothetical protein